MQAARKEARGGRDLKDELGRIKYEDKRVRKLVASFRFHRFVSPRMSLSRHSAKQHNVLPRSRVPDDARTLADVRRRLGYVWNYFLDMTR